MKKTLKVDAKAKNGNAIAKGTTVEIVFPKEHHGMIYRMIAPDGTTIACRTKNISHYFGVNLPTMKQLEKWFESGVVKSIGGKNVEPDGWDCDGTPSWFLALGLM